MVWLSGRTRVLDGPLPADSGWRLPFDLDALLALPRAEEIEAVWARWERR